MILLTEPAEVIIEGSFSTESLRYVARMKKDPEYTKAYGRTMAEALGYLIIGNPDFFLGIQIEVRENK